MNSNNIRELIKLISKKDDKINLLYLLNSNTKVNINELLKICYKKQYIDVIRELRKHYLFDYNHINKFLTTDTNFYITDIIYYILFVIEEINQYQYVPNFDIQLSVALAKKYGYVSEYNYIVQKNYNNIISGVNNLNF